MDAFLGPPGSIADVFQVENDVTGETALRVNNTSPFGGALNQDGIVVVEVLGNVQPNAFFLENGPIDAGFFVYELFFEPGATNIFELRSGAPGSSAFILPQLITASQDIWHATAGTWFDRSADLRVLLNGGGPGMGAGGYGMQPMRAAPPIDQAGYSAFGQSVLNTPAVWAKGSGTWLDRDGSGTKIDWADDFDRWVGEKVEAGDAQALAQYREQAPNAALAHPSDEHFLPLLVAMGAANGKGKRIHDSFNLGSLSMAAYEWK